MNMKKIFALGVATVMMLSSVAANAATKEELQAREPKVTIEVGEQITTLDAYKAATFNKRAAYRYFEDLYDYYPVTIKVTDIGYIAVNDDETTGVSAINVQLKTKDLVDKSADGEDISVGPENQILTGASVAFGQSGVNPEYYGLIWSTTGEPYPTYGDEGNTIENGEMEFKAVLVVNEAATVTITEGTVQLTYSGDAGNVTNSNGKITNESIVLGTVKDPDPEPAADVVVNSGDKYDNGYVWNVTVNKDMEAFGVKFYSGEDTLAKSVKNVDALPKLDGGVGYNFNVGLKTAKTIDQADFTADDATASWKAE